MEETVRIPPPPLTCASRRPGNFRADGGYISFIKSRLRGNLSEADIEGGSIVKSQWCDRQGNDVSHPTADSGPRRMHMDYEGRLWIGEYWAQKIAMFDSKTAQFQE